MTLLEAANELHATLRSHPSYRNVGVGTDRLFLYVKKRTGYQFKWLGKIWRGYPLEIVPVGKAIAY